MTSGFDNLPDFSKGEDLGSSSPNLFQPLFEKPVEQQLWEEEAALDFDDTSCELEALVLEPDQLPNVDIDGQVEVSEELEICSEEFADVAPPTVLQEEHDAAIEALRREHADEIARLKAEHNEQVLQKMEGLHQGVVEGVADRIEMELANLLLPLFKKDVARSNMEQLIAEIRQLVKSEAVDRIQLSGPDILTTAASMALAGSNLKIDVETTGSTDLLVHLNEKILSTSIGDWTRKVEEALGT
ncbi:MAG: hypothetical protein HRU27_08020 [Rhizobiaceae bacterium]|nr:hypothetical protein [Hyphomicrobiales bacterium]NRB30527.1 hypothetical protein [Rhizobiaceae bacterium]